MVRTANQPRLSQVDRYLLIERYLTEKGISKGIITARDVAAHFGLDRTAATGISRALMAAQNRKTFRYCQNPVKVICSRERGSYLFTVELQ